MDATAPATANICWFLCQIFPYSTHMYKLYITHRRRIYLEDKAKVVASDWGTESLPLAILPRSLTLFETNGWRRTVELNRLFQKDRGKTASAAKILSPNPTRRPLPCLLIQSFFNDYYCTRIGAFLLHLYCKIWQFASQTDVLYLEYIFSWMQPSWSHIEMLRECLSIIN